MSYYEALTLSIITREKIFNAGKYMPRYEIQNVFMNPPSRYECNDEKIIDAID